MRHTERTGGMEAGSPVCPCPCRPFGHRFVRCCWQPPLYHAQALPSEPRKTARRRHVSPQVAVGGPRVRARGPAPERCEQVGGRRGRRAAGSGSSRAGAQPGRGPRGLDDAATTMMPSEEVDLARATGSHPPGLRGAYLTTSATGSGALAISSVSMSTSVRTSLGFLSIPSASTSRPPPARTDRTDRRQQSP